MLQETNTSILESKVQLEHNMESEMLVQSVPINSDFIGVSGSFLCLVHCLAPQLIALGSVGLGISTFFASEGWTLFFLFTCFLAVWQSIRKSVYLNVQILLALSFVLFTTGILVEFFTNSESLISYLGSAALIFAHFVNFKKQKSWNKYNKSYKYNA